MSSEPKDVWLRELNRQDIPVDENQMVVRFEKLKATLDNIPVDLILIVVSYSTAICAECFCFLTTWTHCAKCQCTLCLDCHLSSGWFSLGIKSSSKTYCSYFCFGSFYRNPLSLKNYIVQNLLPNQMCFINNKGTSVISTQIQDDNDENCFIIKRCQWKHKCEWNYQCEGFQCDDVGCYSQKLQEWRCKKHFENDNIVLAKS